MLQLYDLNHNKISPLVNYKDFKIERDLTGNEVLSFSYPFNESENIKEESYIRTQTQEFVVKEISNFVIKELANDDEWISVVAKINLESIKGESVENLEVVNSTITNAVNLALVGTGWTLAYTDITKHRTVRKTKCSAYDVLEEIRKIYKCEFKYDSVNKTISIYSSMGQDKGTYFTDELNLRKLTLQSNSYDFCTRIIPIGKDGLRITDVNGGLDYVENYQYSSKVATVIWEDNRYIDAQALKEDAIIKLDELSKPTKSYSADIVDLAKVSDKYTDILDYSLGDTIILLSRHKRIKEKQRIVKIIEYPEEPERNTCEIANRTLRFEDTQSDVLDATDTVESITTSDGMVDESKINFDPIRHEFQTIVSDYALFTDLSAANARIGMLEATSATVTQLDVVTADIEDLYSIKATVTDLTAATARIGILEVDTANINTILAKSVFAELAEFGQIIAGSSIIAQGAIGSAQISDLSASKLSAGIADLAIVTIQGTDGRLKIANNLLQVFAGTTTLFERIALGDVNGDGTVYGLRIRGTDGTTILFDENGQTKEGFTDGYNKLTDNSLSPAKLDIAQVVTRINNGTTTIDSSKIYMDDKTLEIAFSEINNAVISQGETITSQGSSITALNNAITLKVDSQTYDSKMSSLDGSISTINSTLGTQSSSISVLQGEIVNKVTQTEVNTAKSEAISEANLYTDGIESTITTRISTAEASITQNANNIALKVSETDYNGNTIASLINQSTTTIDIQASKINLVGAVTVLSDITGNLGIITAGTINGIDITGVTITGSIFTSSFSGSDVSKSWIGAVVLDEDSLDITQTDTMVSGSYPIFNRGANYKIGGVYYEFANAGMGYGNHSFDANGIRWVAEGGGESDDWFRASIERVSGLGIYDNLSISVDSGGSLLLGSEEVVEITAPNIHMGGTVSVSGALKVNTIPVLLQTKGLNSGADLNNYLEEGSYRVYNGINAPVASGDVHFTVKKLHTNPTGYVQQLATLLNGRRFVRTLTAGVWSDWVSPTAQDLGTNFRLVHEYNSGSSTFPMLPGYVYLIIGRNASSPLNAYVGYAISNTTNILIVNIHKGTYASVVGSGTNVTLSNTQGYATYWRVYQV